LFRGADAGLFAALGARLFLIGATSGEFLRIVATLTLRELFDFFDLGAHFLDLLFFELVGERVLE
jgi:hypothetical protein